MKKTDIYTWSDAILDTLKHFWINTIFWYPWWAVIPFYDRISYHKDIKHILVRNEQWASFAAQWYARTKKWVWVCVTTSWPWATNAITWIADAFMDSIPMIVITWQVAYPTIWNDMFQELDITWITLNITKHNFLIEKPDDIISVISEAFFIATTWRPWPVHIDIPKNVFSAEHPRKFTIPQITWIQKQKQTVHIPDNHTIAKIITELNKSKQPILLLWHGIKHSNAELVAKKFIKKTWIPVVTTLLSKGVLNNDDPHYLGMIWMHWFYHANHAIYNADLIINIWSRFDDRIVGNYETFGKNAKIIHIDIDKSELNKVVKTDIPVHTDAKLFLEKILEQTELRKLNIKERWEQINKWNKEHPYEYETKKFTVKSVLNKLNNEIAENINKYIYCTDVWQHQMWSAQLLKLNWTQQWMSSGWAWTMGFSLPTSIWACFANPDKTIINIVWDGGIQMNIQELQTIKDHNLDIKIILMNNGYLGMVRQWQDLFFKKNYSATPITSPDYMKLAQAYWIKWVKITNEKELEQLNKKLLQEKWPILIECVVEKDNNIFPMVPPWKSLNETLVW